MIRIIAVIFFAFFAGCASLPIDTLNKRIAAFEITYGETLKVIDLWIQEGRLTGTDKTAMQANVKAASEARAAMYIAKGVGDLESAQGKLNAASASLKLIRDYITRNEQRPPPQTRAYYQPIRGGLPG